MNRSTALMCSNGFAASPKAPKQKTPALVSPFHLAAFGCEQPSQAVKNTAERQRMTTTRSVRGVGLENDPATIWGTTRTAPIRGKGTEYAAHFGLSFVRNFGIGPRAYPKAERAKLWGGERMRLKYSEITPDMLRVLRIYAALESCYPQHGDRATRAVAGYAAWRVKRRTPQAASTGPGMKQDQELSPSQSQPIPTSKSAVHQSPCELKGSQP